MEKTRLKKKLIEKVNSIWQAGYKQDLSKSAYDDIEDILDIVREELLEILI